MSRLLQRDVDFDGYRVRTLQGGEGKPLLLLHGTGPGTSAFGNFSRIFDHLSEHYSVLAADLIGFGGSDRKTEEPFFDFDLFFVGDVVLDFSVSIFGLLKSSIIFSASFELISLVARLIFDLIRSIIFSSYKEPFKL